VDSAITVAKKVVEKDPSSGQGWLALGWTYEHDSFGRRFAGSYIGNWIRFQYFSILLDCLIQPCPFAIPLAVGVNLQ
jgi:hypothetical protein